MLQEQLQLFCIQPEGLQITLILQGSLQRTDVVKDLWVLLDQICQSCLVLRLLEEQLLLGHGLQIAALPRGLLYHLSKDLL